MSDVRTIDPIEWIQECLFYGLRSCALFDYVNVVLEKKFLLDSTIDLSALWLTPASGRCGVGGIVEMPTLRVDKPNSQVETILASVVFVEERNLNFSPTTGTLKTAEQWGQLAKEFMRGWIIGQAGGLTPEADALVPATDWMPPDSGVVAWRAAINLRSSRIIIPRCDKPVLEVSSPALLASLFNGSGSPDAEIYYTTDGSFPGRAAILARDNMISNLYTEPFTVESGTLVQWAAYETDKLPSHVGSQIIT